VFALVLTQLLDLVHVAGQAGLGHGALEGHFQRRMRVGMAHQAVLLVEMHFALVALSAEGDIVFR
jgi:hypothetical protein